MLNYNKLLKEIELLKAELKQQQLDNKAKDEKIINQNKKIDELQKLNNWYIEQLRLNRAKKFGASSEKVKYEGVEQLSLFNEAEAEKEPFIKEPELEKVVINKRKKKANKGAFLKGLVEEIVEYKLSKEEHVLNVSLLCM